MNFGNPPCLDATRRIYGCAIEVTLRRIGSDFTLLRLDPQVEVGAFVAAAARRGVPMTRLDVEADEAGALYPHKLLLSRPDQHVAWRGNKLPDNPIALIDQVRGASAST